MAEVARSSLLPSFQREASSEKASTRGRSTVLALAAAIVAACSSGGGSGAGGLAPTITYSGPARWVITGPQGGPFENTSLTVLLGNPGGGTARWSASAVPSFVHLDVLGGTIAPGSLAAVHANLDSAAASQLLAGRYSEILSFHNDDGGQADVDVDCELSIASPGVAADLAPATGFATQGPASGPFAPEFVQYTLTNTGTVALAWRADVSVPWIEIAPQSTVLAPGDSVSVLLAVDDPATAGLGLGLHLDAVDFVDASNDVILHTRDVSLNVLADSSSAGWTDFRPSADTRIVYVSSSSGDDSNDGLTHASPKRTIAAGKALLRDGFPDWLLLRRGESWDESLDTNQDFGLDGRSLTERMLVTGYGTGDRPLLRTGIENGVDSLTKGNHVAIVGLHFWADAYDGSQNPNRGVQWLGSSSDFLLEDCYVQAYESNVVIMGTTGRQTNATVRRNVIVDAYNTLTSNSEGIYVDSVDGLLIEENVFDHNGWRDDVAGSIPTLFRRNVYIQNGCTGVVFRGNIVAATDGLQLRPGGICDDNLFLRNALSLQFGSGNTPEPNGVSGTVRDNVILDGGNLGTGNPRGSGLILGNTVNTVVERNVVAHNVTGSLPIPWILNFDNGQGNPAGMQNVTFRNNVVDDWGGIGANAEVATDFDNVILNLVFDHNDVQNAVDSTYLAFLGSTTPDLIAQIHGSGNRWYRASGVAGQMFRIGGVDMSFGDFVSAIGDSTSTFEAVAYPDPNRTIATYHASIGGAPSLEAFLSEARRQSKSYWRVQYTANAVNDYVRAGFGL